MKTKQITFIALFAALMCILSPFSIPVGIVPISLATFALYLVGALLDYKYSFLVVLVYILIGLCGLPVFSSFRGGPGVLVGPTGGYIFGYVLCVVVESLIIKFSHKKKWSYPIAMVVGTIILYLFGTIWFMVVTEYTLVKALMVCVVPFLIGDVIKIVCASILSMLLRDRLDHYLLTTKKEEK